MFEFTNPKESEIQHSNMSSSTPPKIGTDHYQPSWLNSHHKNIKGKTYLQKNTLSYNTTNSIEPCFGKRGLNSFPNNKCITRKKFNAFADNTWNVSKMIISVFDAEENLVGNWQNAYYQHFLLFPTLFSEGFFFRGHLKSTLYHTPLYHTIPAFTDFNRET